VITSRDLEGRDEEGRTRAVLGAQVFARTTPEQKVRIVEALRRAGRVVAMTGDGTNDAAAIRLADVGIGGARHSGRSVGAWSSRALPGQQRSA
jgi:cation-transporting P-type ATPase I